MTRITFELGDNSPELKYLQDVATLKGKSVNDLARFLTMMNCGAYHKEEFEYNKKQKLSRANPNVKPRWKAHLESKGMPTDGLALMMLPGLKELDILHMEIGGKDQDELTLTYSDGHVEVVTATCDQHIVETA